MKRALILLLLALIAGALPAQSRVVLSVGHAGPVRDAVSHPEDEIAFTVGDDGRLLVWDLELNALLHRYQISSRPIVRVVHHPDRDEVALVVNEGVESSCIVAINWRTGEELFRRELDGVPVHLSYSPAGSYVVYSLPTFQSLFFLTADRGSLRSYLDDGFGIVNFVQMGSTERNLMTYVPARGEFIYWNLQSGNEIQRVQTLERLDHLTLVDPTNRRALAAARSNELVVVDNVTGETESTYPVTPIHDIRFDEENNRIMVLTDQLGRRTVLTFTYSGGRLRRDSYRPSELSPTAQFVVPLAASANAVLAGDEEGTVDLFSERAGRRTELGPRPIVPVLDAAFTEGRLHFSLGDHILTIVSDAFQSTLRRVRISSVRQSVTELPEMTNAYLERVNQDLLVWGSSEPAGIINSISPPSTTAEPFYVDEDESPVLEVRRTNGGPVIIHRDGRIIQLSSGFPVERFRYVAVGAQAATWDPEMGLLAAKTNSSVFDSSLIRVDQLTGETVPIPSEAFLSTDVALGDRSTLYSIGLFGSPASPTTRLLRYSGDRFAQTTLLAEIPGEDPDSRVMWDDQTDSLFTTIGHGGLLRIEGRTTEPLDATGQVGREIVLGGLFVATVNADGSVTLWNRYTGDFLFDIYVFEDDEWIAMNSRGAFLASSSQVEQFLNFIPERRSRLDLDDFRISLPYRE